MSEPFSRPVQKDLWIEVATEVKLSSADLITGQGTNVQGLGSEAWRRVRL